MKLTDSENKTVDHMRITSGGNIALVQFCLPLYVIVYTLLNWSTLSLLQSVSLLVVSVIIGVLFFGYWTDVRKLISIIEKYENS